MKKLICGILFIFVLLTQVNAYADFEIYGWVYNENNEPLEHIKVSTSDSDNVFNTTTEDSGYYTLSGLRPQKYALKYEDSGARSGNSEIVGEVYDADDNSLKGVTVTLNGTVTSYQSQTKEIDLTITGGYWQERNEVGKVRLAEQPSTLTTTESVTTGKDGAFQFNNLSAGDYTLTFEKDGYQTYTKSISFGNGTYYDFGRTALEKVVLTPTPSSTPTQTQIDITGYWEGYFSTSLIDTETIYLDLTQFKKRIDGTLRTGGGARGVVTGRVNGDIFKFRVKETTKKCKGTFKGTATITVSDNDTQVLQKNKLQIESTQFDLRSSTSMYMEFTLTGRDCLGKHKNGEGYVIKQ